MVPIIPCIPVPLPVSLPQTNTHKLKYAVYAAVLHTCFSLKLVLAASWSYDFSPQCGLAMCVRLSCSHKTVPRPTGI